MEINTDIVVIGAGLTGLTTAHYLKKQNNKFIVLEKNNRVGGVISTVKENNFIFEEGPNTGVIGNTTVVELFDELSIFCELEIAADTVNKRYILKNGKWEHLPMGLIDAIKTPLFTFKDKIRILGEPFRAPGKNPHENLSSLVRRRLGESFLNYAVDPFILGVYAGDPDYLITKYALPKLYNLEQKYGSFVGGSVKKGFEKKTEPEKKVNKKVFSFKNGMGSLIDSLYKSADENNFILGASDIKINPVNNGFKIRYKNKINSEIIIKSNKIITTVGAYELGTMLPFAEKNTISNIDSLLYTKVIEVILGFNKWDGMKPDGFGGLIPFIEKRDLLGILFMSSLFKNRAPESGQLFSIFMGGVRRQDIMNLNDDEIKKVVEKECLELLSLKQFNPDLFKIIRHNKAIPQYGIESGERFKAVEEIEKKYKGLLIGGNLKGGIGMADRIKQGKELAANI
ncbi:MAG: protoporphyrinogen oxidase [Bacteroidales bacterium]|nr:protoporphyrinogen oxidase [Bacteroidales bacterium]